MYNQNFPDEHKMKPTDRLPVDTFYQTAGPSSSTSSAIVTYQNSTRSDHQNVSSRLSNQSGGNPEQSMVQPNEMNDFLDSYFVDPLPTTSSSTASSSSQHFSRMEAAKKAAEEDLEVLLKETDDMTDIQNQIHLEQVEMVEKLREERSRQRRAAAARSRYQKMSENERRLYNHRRRLKSLGGDSTDGKNDDVTVRDQVKQANAKKAEAARARYHRMSAEQKRDYNMRRTEAFRRRRLEEEQLLSTPAGRISAEALAKAQQIMVRNQRKAESARLRYQKMTPDERKEYNLRRAAAKRRKPAKQEDDSASNHQMGQDEGQNLSDVSNGLMSPVDDLIDDEDMFDEVYEEDESLQEVKVEQGTSEDHMLHVINDVATPAGEDIFQRMENEVLRRTRIANAQILKQNPHHQLMNSYQSSSTFPSTSGVSNAVVGGIQYDMTVGTVASSSKTHVIDEKMLQDMVRTGVDLNGLPVEVRTVDGRKINSLNDLIAVCHGQTVLITQQHPQESKQYISEPSISEELPPLHQGNEIESEQDYEDDEMDDCYDDSNLLDNSEDILSPEEEKLRMVRARRAERARARYHRMSVDKRKEQNAKRALTLRKSRARDDQLCQLAETVPHDQIDQETLTAIREAQARRAKRAAQARKKYQKMNSEQRRMYNAQRDAQRKNKQHLAGPDGKHIQHNLIEGEPKTGIGTYHHVPCDQSGNTMTPSSYYSYNN